MAKIDNMGDKAGVGNFKKNPKNINKKGRPKKMETVLRELFLDEYNFKLSKSQANDVISSILTKTKSELVELGNKDDVPFWVSLIAKKAVVDHKKGSIELLEKLFDRVHGKPKNESNLDITTGGKTIEGFKLGDEFIEL